MQMTLSLLMLTRGSFCEHPYLGGVSRALAPEHCLLTVIPLKRQTQTDALCMSTAKAVGFVIFCLANLFSTRTKGSN